MYSPISTRFCQQRSNAPQTRGCCCWAEFLIFFICYEILCCRPALQAAVDIPQPTQPRLEQLARLCRRQDLLLTVVWTTVVISPVAQQAHSQSNPGIDRLPCASSRMAKKTRQTSSADENALSSRVKSNSHVVGRTRGWDWAPTCAIWKVEHLTV